MVKEYDIIKAKQKLSETVLEGTEGVVVMVYNEPTRAYEVEFFDEQRNTIDVLTVYPIDIEQL